MTVYDLKSGSGTRSLRSLRALAFSSLATIASVVAAFGLAAFAASEPSVKTIEVLIGFTAVAVLLWRFGLGVWIAILVLGGVDALPGPQLETIETPLLHIFLSDTLIVVLIATLILDNCRDGFRHLADSRVRRLLCIWSGIFLLLWMITVARSYVWAEIPLGHAMDFGRDFAFFAVSLPLLAATLTRPRVRQVTLVALAIGAIVTEIAEIISIVTHHTLTFLVHPKQTTELNSLTRLYVDAQYLAVLAAMLGLGLLFFGQTRRLRLLGSMLATLSITSVVLELTRAQYVGGTVGLATALVVWLVFNPRSGRSGRRQSVRLLLILTTLVALIALIHPPQISNTAISGVEERVSSVFTTLSSTNGNESTVAYREVEASKLEQVLGSSWVFGLGFLDPRSHYVLGIRNGSIRNGDVGVLNAVMTMGVVGAILVYFPVVFILAGLVRRAIAGTERPAHSWIAFGISAWAIAVLTSSLTLVSLFSSSGLCIAALALGLGATCLGTELAPPPGTALLPAADRPHATS